MYISLFHAFVIHMINMDGRHRDVVPDLIQGS